MALFVPIIESRKTTFILSTVFQQLNKIASVLCAANDNPAGSSHAGTIRCK